MIDKVNLELKKIIRYTDLEPGKFYVIEHKFVRFPVYKFGILISFDLLDKKCQILVGGTKLKTHFLNDLNFHEVL